MLSIRLSPDRASVEILLPNDLWKAIPATPRGMEIIYSILIQQANTTDHRTGTNAAPTQRMIYDWAANGINISKYREDGTLDITDLEI